MSVRVAAGDALFTCLRSCQLPPRPNAKPGGRGVLARQDELGDREQSPFLDSLEGSLQKRDDRAMAARIDRAGQRHVKAEVLEHERVTPTVEVFDLASARARGNAPVPLL